MKTMNELIAANDVYKLIEDIHYLEQERDELKFEIEHIEIDVQHYNETGDCDEMGEGWKKSASAALRVKKVQMLKIKRDLKALNQRLPFAKQLLKAEAHKELERQNKNRFKELVKLYMGEDDYSEMTSKFNEIEHMIK